MAVAETINVEETSIIDTAESREKAREMLGKILASAVPAEPDWGPLAAYGYSMKLVWESWRLAGPIKARAAYEAIARADSSLAGLDAPADNYYPDEIIVSDILGKRLDKIPCSDAGQGEVIAQLYIGRLRFSPGLGWLIWTGYRWQRDDRSATSQFALLAARAKQQAVLKRAIPDDDSQAEKAWVSDIRWAKRAEDERRLSSALALAATMPVLVVPTAELDQHDHLLGVANGVVDLERGTLRTGEPRDLITQTTGVPFYPDAQAPRWEQFLCEVFDNNESLIKYIRRAVGYSLTGSTKEQCYFQCYGTGANGKSTLLQILQELAGEYARETPFLTFESGRQSNQGYDLADLRGKRIVLSSETADGARLNEARIKAVTGGDTISARHLYKEYFQFTPKFHLWFASNHKPQIRGTDTGIWRRVRLIPFDVSFVGKADKDLLGKLRAELPGILAWAVRGATEWYHVGLQEPDIVKAATEEYRADSDALGHFINECAVLGADKQALSKPLYEAYRNWAVDNGLNPMNNLNFSKALQERGFMKNRSNKGVVWAGIGLMIIPISVGV